MTTVKLYFVLMISLLGSLQLNAQTTDSLINQLSRKWIHTKQYVLQMAELMPEEGYHYKPVAEIMSFKQQLLHIADNMQWLSSTYLLEKRQIPEPDTAKMDKAAVLKYVSDAYDMALEAHHKLDNDKLNEVVPFFAGPMSRRQVLILIHDHQTHHSGQLILYLRLKGIKPPAYVGW